MLKHKPIKINHKIMEIRIMKSFLEKRRKKGSIMKKETLVLLLSHEINTHVSLKMMEQQENEKK